MVTKGSIPGINGHDLLTKILLLISHTAYNGHLMVIALVKCMLNYKVYLRFWNETEKVQLKPVL